MWSECIDEGHGIVAYLKYIIYRNGGIYLHCIYDLYNGRNGAILISVRPGSDGLKGVVVTDRVTWPGGCRG